MTTVLVVDDEANLVELVGGYLEREGFVVVTAGDGPAALHVARAQKPEVVVLDLVAQRSGTSTRPPNPRAYSSEFPVARERRPPALTGFGIVVMARMYWARSYATADPAARRRLRLPLIACTDA